MSALSTTTPPIVATSVDSGNMPRRVSESSSGELSPLKDKRPFPFKLYRILEYAADSEYSSVISWIQEGRAFAIHDKDRFVESVVPNFFKQTKFRSFERQLNLWGFTRLSTQGPNMGAWAHKNFIRGRVECLSGIERVEVKGAPKAEDRKPKNVKCKQARSIKAGLNSVATATSLEYSTDGSGSLASEERIAPSNLLSSPVISIENAPIQPVIKPLMINESLPSHTTCWPSTMAPYPQLPAAVPLCSVDEREIHVQVYPETFQTSNSSRPGHVDLQHVTQQYEDDLLCAFSGIFNSDEAHSNDDDLSSILSLNEASEYSVNPFSI